MFKRNKDWLLLDLWLELLQGEADALRARAKEIRALRDEKFPPSMSCAGSIFKNLYLSALPLQTVAIVPERTVQGGKVASAFFLEQGGAKCMCNGTIEIEEEVQYAGRVRSDPSRRIERCIE